jgi:hypothetical protein
LHIFAAILDAVQIYTDHTGCFPVISSRVIVSIMVFYEYDGNEIMAEPIKKQQIGRTVAFFSRHGTQIDFQRTQTQNYDIGQ